jgi:hypothetical protein
MTKYLQLLFFSIYFLIGLATASYSLWSCVLSYQAKSWPSVSGEVVSDDCLTSDGGTSELYIQYKYTVNSITYSNSQEGFGLRFLSNECFDGIRKNENITVYYDATNPANAALKPDDYRNGIFGFIVGLAFMAFSNYCYFIVLQKPKPSINVRGLYNNNLAKNYELSSE